MTTLQVPPPPDIRAIWAKGRVREQIRVQREAELEAIERSVLMNSRRREQEIAMDAAEQVEAQRRETEMMTYVLEGDAGESGWSFLFVFLVIFVITVLAAYALGGQMF